MMASASLADVGRSLFANWLMPLPSDVLYILSQSTNRAVNPGEDRSKSSNDLTDVRPRIRGPQGNDLVVRLALIYQLQ